MNQLLLMLSLDCYASVLVGEGGGVQEAVYHDQEEDEQSREGHLFKSRQDKSTSWLLFFP